MNLSEMLKDKEETKKTYVRLIYTDPKKSLNSDYYDADEASKDLKKEVRKYGGRVADVKNETIKGFTWLIEFSDYKKAKQFEHTFDDAGRTKLIRTLTNAEGRWWDIKSVN